MQRRVREVLEGQRYQKLGAGGGLWEVVAVRADAAGAVHARLRSAEDVVTYRTWAVEAILDLRNFRLVEND